MGASTFTVVASGRTAKEAFLNAVDTARFEKGHGGYSGTIAEKHTMEYLSYAAVSLTRAMEIANVCLGSDTHWCSDKWGPAACVPVEEKGQDSQPQFLFFGWASS